MTGSVAGLGYASAKGLAKSGANVVLNGLCNPAEGQTAAQKLADNHGSEAMFDSSDLRHNDKIERMGNVLAGKSGCLGALSWVVSGAGTTQADPWLESFGATKKLSKP